MLIDSIKYCINDNWICVYFDFCDCSWSGVIFVIFKLVLCDMWVFGVYFE